MTPMEQGAALLGGGRFHEALTVFGQALQQDPSSARARMGLGQAMSGTGDAMTAIAWFADARRVAPDWPEPAHLLGEQLLALKLYPQALPVYQRLYVELQTRDRVTVLHHAFCLEQTGATFAAVTHYREALGLYPDFMEAHVNLAGVLWRVGEHEGALTHARRAVELAPAHPYAVRILGTALLHLSRLDEAEIHLRHALALQPGFALATIDLSLTLLLAGRLEEGWALYHERWSDAQRMNRPHFYRAELEWQGPQRQPPQGLRVLVYAEQGLGDVIQFMRYAPLLQADGATVFAVVQPELVNLVESMPGVTCHKPGTDIEADCHVALMDLPFHYGTTLANLPASALTQVPYLHPPEGRVAHWRERLKPWDGVLKVGLAWAGNAAQVNHLNRCMPLSALAPLLAVDGVQFFSLQKSDGGEFTDMPIEAQRLIDFTPEWHDFSDSAAMVAGLDLVITVDTALAHLAGALGQSVWLMLGPNPDWRWLLEREDSPWYPTLRLFRRGYDETRGVQIARVVKELKARKRALGAGRQGRLLV